MSYPIQSTANVWASERRLHPRFPTLFTCVQLEGDNGGIVLDVSEHGLSMRIVRSLADNQSTQIRFQLARPGNWVETHARLVWTDQSRTVAGVQFDCLSSEGRILLRHSISSIANPIVVATAGGRSENEASAKSAIFGAEPASAHSNLDPETRTQATQSSGRPSNGPAASFVSTLSQSKWPPPHRDRCILRQTQTIASRRCRGFSNGVQR